MTDRDYLAAKAMQGMIGNPKAEFGPTLAQIEEGVSWADLVAEMSYDIADAMIKYRDFPFPPFRPHETK